jgi:hypothetical protein
VCLALRLREQENRKADTAVLELRDTFAQKEVANIVAQDAQEVQSGAPVKLFYGGGYFARL